MTCVALWRLLHYDVCCIMMFVALWRLSFMTFVLLWCLSHYDVCRIMMFVALWRLSPIMTFVASRVCRSIDLTHVVALYQTLLRAHLWEGRNQPPQIWTNFTCTKNMFEIDSQKNFPQSVSPILFKIGCEVAWIFRGAKVWRLLQYCTD